VGFDGRDESERIGAGDGFDAPVDRADPGDDGAVSQAEEQIHPHGDPATLPDDDAHDVGPLAGDGHQVDQRDRALGGFEVGLEDQRTGAVPPSDGAHFALRCDLPAAVVARAEQGGEAGIGIETGEAEPIEGAVIGHQRYALAVGDDGVVFDARGHH